MALERVLVIPKSEFDSRNPFTGFAPIGPERLDLGEYLQGAPEKLASFISKDLAEQDESHLQIIPYITLMCNEALFTYRRGPSGGEDRLHHQLSIGIGGHINDQDDPDEPFFAFLEGTRRELREEVGLDLPHEAFKERVVGLLFDDSNAVGRVHLGVSIIIALDEEMAKTALNRAAIELHEPRFVPIKDFKGPGLSSELETWSQFVINHILGETGESTKANDWGFRERAGMGQRLADPHPIPLPLRGRGDSIVPGERSSPLSHEVGEG